MDAPLTYDEIWQRIYEEGRHLVRYPYDFVIVFVARHAPRDRPRKDVKILEIASGPGNNVWFAAREGFSVSGIDASPKAIEYAQRRLAEDGLEADLRVGDFTALPYEDDTFDLVIDRGGIVCTGISSGKKAVEEVRRVLKPGGRFLFNPFSSRDIGFTKSEPGPDGTRINITAGHKGVGQLSLYDRSQVDAALANGWKVLSLEHVEVKEFASPDESVHAEWRVISEKLPSA